MAEEKKPLHQAHGYVRECSVEYDGPLPRGGSATIMLFSGGRGEIVVPLTPELDAARVAGDNIVITFERRKP